MGSDHFSFISGLRVPAVHFFTGLHGDYHSPRDTADTINAPGAVKVLDVAARLGEELWTRPGSLTYQTSKAGAAAAAGGPSAYLGIVPDEAAEPDKGLPVMSVLPGSPADNAGVKPGDVLVRLNDKPINKFKDLLDALGAGKPGDKVKLVLQRNGQTIETDATLGKRGG